MSTARAINSKGTPYPDGYFYPLHTQLDQWDRAAFGCDMRRIEILILRGLDHIAREVFEHMLRRETRTQPTLETYCSAVLPVRIAERLAGDGYLTLHSVAVATDKALLKIPHFGPVNLALVRRTIACVHSGSALPDAGEDLTDLYPDWPIDLCCTCGGTTDAGRPPASTGWPLRVVSPDPLDTNNHQRTDSMPPAPENREPDLVSALEQLMAAGNNALAQIDAKIQDVIQQLDTLKRLRSLLDPTQYTPSRAKATPLKRDGKHDATAAAMEKYILTHGPTKPSVLGEAIKVNYTNIGRVARAYDELFSRLDDGRIAMRADTP